MPPALPAALALLGYNAQNNFTDLSALEAIKSGGGTLVRFQPSWSSAEDYASGTLSLGSSIETALAYCGSNGLQPIAVCAYGPPYSDVMTLTVASTTATGSYSVPIVESLSGISTPLDHVYRSDATQITGKWAYYGSLIDSVSGSNIVLASATTTTLNPGDTLTVNRLRYASPADQLLTNTSLIAYFRYLEFVAGRIAANGCKGYVSIWNEPPWAHDRWDARGKFYDSVPGGMNADTRMTVFLEYALTVTGLPTGVRIISGATDKTGNDGSIEQNLSPTSAQIQNSVLLESIHPYKDNPEGDLWDRSTLNGSSYQLLNQTADSSSNFAQLAYKQDQAAVGLGTIVTETGIDTSSDDRQAVYLLRCVAATWAARMPIVVFDLAGGSNYDVAAPTTYTPRLAYSALQTLMGLVAALGGPGPQKSVPIPIAYQDHTWPMMGLGIYGANGALLLLWQQTTGNETGGQWAAIPTPSTYSAQFAMPSGYSVSSAIDVKTGSTITTSVSSGILTVSDIGEDLVAVRIAA